MREVKFWNGKGYPSIGELYIDGSVLTEEGLHKSGLCYSLGTDFEGGPCFQIMCILHSSSTEEFLYDAYVNNTTVDQFSIANQTHLDLYYKSISY